VCRSSLAKAYYEMYWICMFASICRYNTGKPVIIFPQCIQGSCLLHTYKHSILFCKHLEDKPSPSACAVYGSVYTPKRVLQTRYTAASSAVAAFSVELALCLEHIHP